MSGMRILLGLGLSLVCVQHVLAVAVMSVDLGSQWMKVAVVSVSWRKFRQRIYTLNILVNSLVCQWKLL